MTLRDTEARKYFRLRREIRSEICRSTGPHGRPPHTTPLILNRTVRVEIVCSKSKIFLYKFIISQGTLYQSVGLSGKVAEGVLEVDRWKRQLQNRLGSLNWYPLGHILPFLRIERRRNGKLVMQHVSSVEKRWIKGETR